MPQVLYWRDNLPAQRPYLSMTELAPPRHCIGRESTALLGLRLLDVLIGRMQFSLTARSLDGSVCCFRLKALAPDATALPGWFALGELFPCGATYLFLKEGIYPFIRWTLSYYTLTAWNLFSGRCSSSFLPLLPVIIFISTANIIVYVILWSPLKGTSKRKPALFLSLPTTLSYRECWRHCWNLQQRLPCVPSDYLPHFRHKNTQLQLCAHEHSVWMTSFLSPKSSWPWIMCVCPCLWAIWKAVYPWPFFILPCS